MTGLKGFVWTSVCISDGCLATMAMGSRKMSSPNSIFYSPPHGVLLALTAVTQAPSLCLCCCSQPLAACLSHADRSVTSPRKQLWFFSFYLLMSVVVSLGGKVYITICTKYFCIVFQPSKEPNVENLTGVLAFCSVLA